MTGVTVNLTPPLDGVVSEVGYFFNDVWIKLINMPNSVAGVITSGVVFNGTPEGTIFHLFIPSQTIGGIEYGDALSGGWIKTAPSFTENITLEPLAEAVSSTLTISAPSSVADGASFNISGILIRNDTGGPVPNATISLFYNGSPLGSATTGVDGDYLKAVSIPSPGSYTLKASFAGISGLDGSEAVKGISVGVIPMSEIIIPLLVGVSIFYLVRRI